MHSLNGRVTKLEQVVQVDPLAMTPEEMAEEATFKAQLAAWHAQWDYVTARHIRRKFLTTIGFIPPHWPCAQILEDPVQDWETIAPDDELSVRFWLEERDHFDVHCRLAQILGTSPRDVPLTDNVGTPERIAREAMAMLERAALEGNAEARLFLDIVYGRVQDPATTRAIRLRRQDLHERYGVPLDAIPQDGAFWALLWRYPQSKRELLRHIARWQRDHA